MIKGHTDIDIWNTGFFINADYFSDDDADARNSCNLDSSRYMEWCDDAACYYGGNGAEYTSAGTVEFPDTVWDKL